jgi:hypothetical protein
VAELLTNVVCGNGYTPQATLGPALDVKQLVFQVFNEPVYAKFYKPGVGDDNRMQPVEELVERYFPVGTLLSVDGAAGAQFRNAIAGQNATINAEIAFVGDPTFDFQSSGLFSAAVLTLSVLHDNSLVGAENTLDFEDSSSIAWTVTDTPGTKVAVSAAFVVGSVVTSVFGRTGAVVATTGDYTAAQVTNAADKASAAIQVFSGHVSTGPTSATFGQAGVIATTTGIVFVAGSALTSGVFVASVNGDTERRFGVLAGGPIVWGSGSAATDLQLAREVNSPGGTGSFLELIAGAGFGYGTGIGGAATIVSAGSGAINKPCGQVTGSAAIASGANGTYTVTNTTLGALDTVEVTLVSPTIAGTQRTDVVITGAGSFSIIYENNSGVAVTPKFNFAIIKAANS